MQRWSALVGVVVAATTMVGGSGAAQAATVNAVWHMDDGGSTMVDSSGNGLNGTLSNVQTGQPGAVGAAYRFVAPRSRVDVPSSALLDPGSAVFTVSMRVRFSVRPTAAVGDYDLVRKGLSATAGGSWKVEILGTGKAFCQFIGSNAKLGLSRGPDLADGAWHSVSCRRSSTSIRLTVDGRNWSVAGSTGTIRNSSAVVVGAKNSAGEDQYQGLMDELQVSAG